MRILLCLSLLSVVFIPHLQAYEEKRMEMVMGTLLQISIQAETEEGAKQAVQVGFDEIRRWEGLLSNYQKESEISRINREAYPESTGTTREVARFLKEAQALSQETGGYFEIMLDPLSRLWGLRDGKLAEKPKQKMIEPAKLKANSEYLEIYESDQTVRFIIEGIGIDTGGIGKGYALDRALEKVRHQKVTSVTFNFGGEILNWPRIQKISLKDPLNPDQIWGDFLIEHFPHEISAVSTSASYEKPILDEKENHPFSHILNPKTGKPVNNNIKSVTVLSKSGSRADALSTALFAMGLEKAKAFAGSHTEDWVVVLYQEEDSLKSFVSGNLKLEGEPR